jgi:hypothetical protein
MTRSGSLAPSRGYDVSCAPIGGSAWAMIVSATRAQLGGHSVGQTATAVLFRGAPRGGRRRREGEVLGTAAQDVVRNLVVPGAASAPESAQVLKLPLQKEEKSSDRSALFVGLLTLIRE